MGCAYSIRVVSQPHKIQSGENQTIHSPDKILLSG
jgi:hypothetical protein